MTKAERKRIIRRLSNLTPNVGKTKEQMEALATEERKRMTRRNNAIARYKKMGLNNVEISKLVGESVSSIRRFIVTG